VSYCWKRRDASSPTAWAGSDGSFRLLELSSMGVCPLQSKKRKASTDLT